MRDEDLVCSFEALINEKLSEIDGDVHIEYSHKKLDLQSLRKKTNTEPFADVKIMGQMHLVLNGLTELMIEILIKIPDEYMRIIILDTFRKMVIEELMERRG